MTPFMGGAAAAVGAGVGGYIASAGPVTSLLGEAGAIAAGGLAGGAIGGLTSAGLSRAAGYDTDIGLAVAAGAAGGLAGGAIGSGGFGLPSFGTDPAGLAITVIASAAGGAVSSTVSGSDPGMGALFAAGGAALAIASSYVYQEFQKQNQAQLNSDQKSTSDLVVNRVKYNPSRPALDCIGDCTGVRASVDHITEIYGEVYVKNTTGDDIFVEVRGVKRLPVSGYVLEPHGKLIGAETVYNGTTRAFGFTIPSRGNGYFRIIFPRGVWNRVPGFTPYSKGHYVPER